MEIAATEPKPIDTFKRLLAYIRPYRKTFIFALISMLIFGATDGVVPFLIKSILDDVFGARNEQMLYALPVIIVLFAIVRGVFGFTERFLTASIGLWVVRDIRNDLGSHLLSLSPAYFSGQRSGELLSIVNNDTLLLRGALTEGVASLLRDSVRILALLIAACYLDPVLALVGIAAFPLGILPMFRYGRKVRRYSKSGQERSGGLTSILQEMILGNRIIQAFSREDYERERFKRENEQLTTSLQRAEKYGALSHPTNELIASVAIALITLYGGLSVISGVRTQGGFLAFIAALFLLYEPFKKLGRVNAVIQMSLASGERIFRILDTQPMVRDRPGAKELVINKPDIEYDDVCFSYEQREGKAPLALDHVSLRIPAGKTLALVGMSGGGKSTLVSLLPRFFDPTHGEIRISGENIAEVSVASLRRAISLVSQHTFLFNDTVYNNIAYGRADASPEQVMAAAEAANADLFIRKLARGYDTVIGEQGFSLSGGERARIAIARALLKDAPILILDEATASLDSESELLVQEAIERLMSHRTVLVIAHRLATIRRADEIAVVVSGRVVERGTHESLLRSNGEYAKLYRLQFAGQHDLAIEVTERAVGLE